MIRPKKIIGLLPVSVRPYFKRACLKFLWHSEAAHIFQAHFAKNRIKIGLKLTEILSILLVA